MQSSESLEKRHYFLGGQVFLYIRLENLQIECKGSRFPCRDSLRYSYCSPTGSAGKGGTVAVEVRDDWKIEEPDGAKRRVFSGEAPILDREHSATRRFISISLVSLFGVSFMICLVYGLATKDFIPLDLVWKIFGPIFWFVLGYYFALNK